MKPADDPRPGTLSVWAGEDGPHWQRSTQVPVVHSVSFGYDDLDEWLEVGQGHAPGHIYGRNTNPTVQVFEEKVRIMEGAAAATSFASSMAAPTSCLSNSYPVFKSKLPCATPRTTKPSNKISRRAAGCCTWKAPPIRH